MCGCAVKNANELKRSLENPEIQKEYNNHDTSDGRLHVHRLPVQVGGVLLVFGREHR